MLVELQFWAEQNALKDVMQLRISLRHQQKPPALAAILCCTGGATWITDMAATPIVESPIVETFSIENRRKSALLIENLYRKVHQVKDDIGFFEFACSKFLLNIADSYIRLHRHWGLQGFLKMISQLKDIDESFAEHFSLAMNPNHIETGIEEIDFLYREVIMLLGGETNSDENFVSQGIMNILNVVEN